MVKDGSNNQLAITIFDPVIDSAESIVSWIEMRRRTRTKMRTRSRMRMIEKLEKAEEDENVKKGEDQEKSLHGQG